MCLVAEYRKIDSISMISGSLTMFCHFFYLGKGEGMEDKIRDHSIDFFRGLAALVIIFHHVACYSGVKYSPYEIVPATMIIDVPAFMFIAGWSFHYVKNMSAFLIRLVKLIFAYVIFSFFYISFIEIYDMITKAEAINLLEILKMWFLQSSFKGINHEIFSVVNASLWFMPMYVKVYVLYGAGILLARKVMAGKNKNIGYLLAAILLLAVFLALRLGFSVGGIQLTVIFYGMFFVLGYYFGTRKNVNDKIVMACFFANILIIILLDRFTEMKVYGMVNNKFPPSFLFLFYSLFYVMAILYARNHFRFGKTPISYIGENALYFFFAQGFAVSLIKMFDDLIHLPWILKYLLFCAIGVLITFFIAIIIKTLIELLWKIFYSMISFLQRVISDKKMNRS